MRFSTFFSSGAKIMDFALGQNAKSIDTWNRPKPILGHLRCIESSSETFSQISKFRKNDGLGDFFDFRSLRLSIGNMTKCGKIIKMPYMGIDQNLFACGLDPSKAVRRNLFELRNCKKKMVVLGIYYFQMRLTAISHKLKFHQYHCDVIW